jgi:hypothetical protein
MSDVTNLGGFVVAVGAAAAKIQATDQYVSWVILQNDSASAGDVLVGGAAAQTLRLAAGQMTPELCVSQLSSIYAIRQAAGSAANLRVLYGA